MTSAAPEPAPRTEPGSDAGGCILVFARAPEPGQVKTRLIPALGADGAAELHRRLVLHALGVARSAHVGPVQLWCASDVSHPFFDACRRRFGVTLHAQGGGDLGQRMDHALRGALAGRERALLIGTDIPAMSAEYLRAADRALQEAHVVLGPAEDGGYVLIGLRQRVPDVFRDIRWGEASVLERTRAHLARLGLHARELATLWDVDRPDDLERMRVQCRFGPDSGVDFGLAA